MLALPSFEANNFAFNITDENNSFSKATPGYWTCRGGLATINKLREFLAFRQLKDIDLYVEEVRKRGNQIKIGDEE